MTPTITAFANSPDRGRGLARDMRVRQPMSAAGSFFWICIILAVSQFFQAFAALGQDAGGANKVCSSESAEKIWIPDISAQLLDGVATSTASRPVAFFNLDAVPLSRRAELSYQVGASLAGNGLDINRDVVTWAYSKTESAPPLDGAFDPPFHTIVYVTDAPDKGDKSARTKFWIDGLMRAENLPAQLGDQIFQMIERHCLRGVMLYQQDERGLLSLFIWSGEDLESDQSMKQANCLLSAFLSPRNIRLTAPDTGSHRFLNVCS